MAAGKLSFLDTQAKPLLLNEVSAHLGQTEMGDGPFYVYQVEGSTVEFWMAPPPPLPSPGASLPTSVAVQIALVIQRPRDGAPKVLWPPEMRGTDAEQAIHSFWTPPR